MVTVPPPRRRPAGPTEDLDRAAASQLDYLLVHPPLTDPTTAYHSISYLVGAAASAGFTAQRCVDANIEALNTMAAADQVAATLAAAGRQRARIEVDPHPSRADQLRYRTCLKATGLHPGGIADAVALLRDPDRFYDYPAYQHATRTLRRWVELLGIDLPPGLIDGFGLRARGPLDLTSIRDLRCSALLDQIDTMFAPYWDGPFRDLLTGRPWQLIGMSVSYLSQLPFALALARRVRRFCPNAVIALGGTEISDDVKYLARPERLWELFADADVVVIGEGETAFVDLLTGLARDGTVPNGPGIITRSYRSSEVRYEDVAALPAPRYDIWDWSQYWSPEPIILYSPTRGCYWNRCTFCDYGLNTDRPTSPSRERPAPTVAQDLAGLPGNARTVYFAVDAMSPIYLRKLSAALIDVGSPVRWAAELRLERSFQRFNLGAELRRAGCIAISFGYESGSQRILDLIDKGIQVVNIPDVLAELCAHDIGAQMMGFTGFPTETPEEAEATYQLLVDHYDRWALAGIGEFVLTAGAIVARQPDRFGIKLVDPGPASDIHRALRWEPAAPVAAAPGGSRWLRHLKDQIGKLHDDRPFVGGIDSSHSLLYFSRYGPALVPASLRSRPQRSANTRSPFLDLDDFADLDDLEAVDRTGRHVEAWLQSRHTGRYRPATPATIDIYPSGNTGPARITDTALSNPCSRLEELLLAGYGG